MKCRVGFSLRLASASLLPVLLCGAEIHTVVTSTPATDVLFSAGAIYANTANGWLRCTTNANFQSQDLADRRTANTCATADRTLTPPPAVQPPQGAGEIRQSAHARDGRVAIAAANGLYLKTKAWRRLEPRAGSRSWSPIDVRGVAFDSEGRLCFASPQGAGCESQGQWTLWTHEDGLPYDDFTTVATGEPGVVWFGTRIGAIRYDGKRWEYRQGRRWLAGDEVRAIAVTPSGDAWFATPQGISVIERRGVSLAEKAKFFEDEIDKRHRRTEFEYVLSVALKRPGDKSEWTQHDSDNDGLWTSMYGAGECFAYGATGDPKAKERARKAFEAMRHLRLVTQAGHPPAPAGYVARTVLPASGPDPNKGAYAPERDRERQKRDSKWKIMDPRWPRSADGKWFWKSDTSSDELDGHFFFYGLYYDLVAKTEEERRPVREHVAAIADHLLAHDFNLVDHDGKPTRWAIFSPVELNHNRDWWPERGMNSLSILAYLKVAAHITGDARYEKAIAHLNQRHAFHLNSLIAKAAGGAGAGNQSDDEMMFMNWFNLVRYETDPELLQAYTLSLYNHWRIEEPEMNPLFNYIVAAVATGKQAIDNEGPTDLTPRGVWKEESRETLDRFPLDRINWAHRNAHRKDIVRLPPWTREGGRATGMRRNGRVLPVDERHFDYWNHDPWTLDTGGAGNSLSDGAAFLLPYYMGLYYKFL